MSGEQEVVELCVWGFIESREGTPEVIEAAANLVEEFAVLDSMQRAMELGFTGAQARNVRSVLRGVDDHGEFELRQFCLADVELNGIEALFDEANTLAMAADDLLAVMGAGTEGSSPPVERLRAALAGYRTRWPDAEGG